MEYTKKIVKILALVRPSLLGSNSVVGIILII